MINPKYSNYQAIQCLKLSLIHIILAIISVMFISQVVAADSIIQLNITGQPPLNTNNQQGFIDEVANEAFQRINIKLQTVRLPAERGLIQSDRGLIDGELVRIKGLDKIYPNLIRVPEKIMNWKFVAFSYKATTLTNGWSELSGKSVAHINGWKILEKNIPANAEVTKTTNANDLFTLLQKNRTDYAIYEYWGGLYQLNKLSIKNVKICKPPLADKEMFIYLHNKHRLLVPQLTRALIKMKKDGSYQKLVNKHLVPLE